MLYFISGSLLLHRFNRSGGHGKSCVGSFSYLCWSVYHSKRAIETSSNGSFKSVGFGTSSVTSCRIVMNWSRLFWSVFAWSHSCELRCSRSREIISSKLLNWHFTKISMAQLEAWWGWLAPHSSIPISLDSQNFYFIETGKITGNKCGSNLYDK